MAIAYGTTIDTATKIGTTDASGSRSMAKSRSRSTSVAVLFLQWLLCLSVGSVSASHGHDDDPTPAPTISSFPTPSPSISAIPTALPSLSPLPTAPNGTALELCALANVTLSFSPHRQYVCSQRHYPNYSTTNRLNPLARNPLTDPVAYYCLHPIFLPLILSCCTPPYRSQEEIHAKQQWTLMRAM